MKLIKSNTKYDLSAYSLKCPVCTRIFKNNKCFADHIFNANLKDKNHKNFAQYLRERSREDFSRKAKKICPVCDKPILNHLAAHLNYAGDSTHKKFYENQKNQITLYFLEYKSPHDIANMPNIVLDKKWIYRYLNKSIGHENFLIISRKIFSRKRKNYWNSFSKEERKKKMDLVRKAEWSHLTPEQRKNHPWVIAGRKASLESGIRGSKNQKYAYELLKIKCPQYNWVYNYALNENWQIDIAAPEQKIFIEWDGRHHRIPIHGEMYLNNRKNRDYIKNKMVTEHLNGTMIRINDGGRFDNKFVEARVNEIVNLLNNRLEKAVIHL